jgi:hypothetical protein
MLNLQWTDASTSGALRCRSFQKASKLFGILDLVTSTFLVLTCKKFYPLHHAKYGTDHLYHEIEELHIDGG